MSDLKLGVSELPPASDKLPLAKASGKGLQLNEVGFSRILPFG
jgi:hypothetical protein